MIPIPDAYAPSGGGGRHFSPRQGCATLIGLWIVLSLVGQFIRGMQTAPVQDARVPSARVGVVAPVSSAEVIQAIKDAGAEADDPGTLAHKCPGTTFIVTSAQTTGTFFICTDLADVDEVFESLTKTHEVTGIDASVYRHDDAGVVLYLPRAKIDDKMAAKYEAAIASLGK